MLSTLRACLKRRTDRLIVILPWFGLANESCCSRASLSASPRTKCCSSKRMHIQCLGVRRVWLHEISLMPTTKWCGASPEEGEICNEVAFRRSEEHTSELQSLMRISYAVFCLKNKKSTRKHRCHSDQESDNAKLCTQTHNHTHASRQFR